MKFSKWQKDTFVLVFFLVAIFSGLLGSSQAQAQGRLKVMLLGDSYTAGNGARQANGSTDNFGPKGCYRSNSNWGQKYVNQLTNLGYNVTLINRACSGAVSNDLLYDNAMEAENTWMRSYSSLRLSGSSSDDDIYQAIARNYSCDRREQGEEYYRFSIDLRSDNDVTFSCRHYVKAQLDSVDSSVDVVLMTLGGNDVKFSTIVMSCFAPVLSSASDCEKVAEDSRRSGLNTDPGSYQRNMQEIFKKLRSKLRSDAKVVLLNYPYLAKDDNYILKDLLGSNSYEASKNVRELGRLGDEVQASTIPGYQPDKAGIFYFNEVKDEFKDHEPDMTDKLFNNNQKWLNTFNSRLPADWFHPNAQGHQAIADLLYRDLETKVDGLPLKTHLDYDVVFITNEAAEAQQYQKDDLASKGIQIGQIRDKVLSVANTARFGLIDYNLLVGYNKTGPGTKLMQDFTSDINQLALKMPRSTTVEGRTQPGELKNALDMALGLKWRPGVKKLIYIVGKTDGDDNIYGTDYYNNIIEKALNLDPVAISPIRAGNQTTAIDGQATRLADKTNGQTVSPVGMKYYFPINVTNALNTQTLAAPYVWAGEGVSGKVGDEITLNATGSYDQSGITKYEWDVNNDGAYDVTSGQPIVSYVYQEPYEGLVVLRATNQNGVTALASATAQITADGDAVADEQDNCPLDANDDQADADADGLGDVCDDVPGIAGYKVDGEVATEPETPVDETQPADDVPQANDAPVDQTENDTSDQPDQQTPSENNPDVPARDQQPNVQVPEGDGVAGPVGDIFMPIVTPKRLVIMGGVAHPVLRPSTNQATQNTATGFVSRRSSVAKTKNSPIVSLRTKPKTQSKNPKSRGRFNWRVVGGMVSGLGMAAYAFNSELFEDEEI